MGEQDDGRRLIRRKRDDRPGIAASAPRPSQLEDPPWSERRPLNYDDPPSSPVQPSGDLPVIVRLLWETHEELLPARAIRWTDTHAMVVIKALTPPYTSTSSSSGCVSRTYFGRSRGVREPYRQSVGRGLPFSQPMTDAYKRHVPEIL